MKIESAHLILRSPNPADAGMIGDYYTRNRDFLREFMPARPGEFYTEHGQEEQLKCQLEEWESGRSFRFYISPVREEKRIIGFVALNSVVMNAFCSCYLSYQLDKDYINRGLTTEAVEAAVKFGFRTLRLHRIEANIMPGNIRSIRVVEKCGFVNEGLSKQYLKINGVWEDHAHYVKLNGDIM